MDSAYSMAMSIHLKLTDYNGKILGADGTLLGGTNVNNAAFEPTSLQFIKVANFASSVEQTLNIGSQSSGAGAGKIAFNPLTISKYLDATSPILLQNAASGTAYKTAEVFFVSAQNVVFLKHTYKLVAVKVVSWSAGGDAGVLESVSFEYGALVITANKQTPDGKLTGAVQAGWNRIKNVLDSDPDGAIK